eukprot:Skav233930  [mRNA]  locus=scaffold3074:101893:103035:- [translate_table: standard]
MQLASGATFDVMTSSRKTVKQFLTQDLRQHVKEEVRLLSDAQLMLNPKRLHSYDIEDGSVISMVKISQPELEEEEEEDDDAEEEPFVPPPRVAPVEVESGSEESEDEVVETPPMSDGEEAEKNQMMVEVFNYHTKAHMFSDRVVLTQSVHYLKALMFEFEDTSEEDKGNLVVCNARGVALDKQATIGEAMRSMNSRAFFIRVKGLDGGALVRQYQTKQDKLTKLKAKAEAHLKMKIDATADVIVPDAMDAIIASFRQNLDNIIFLKGQGKDIIALGLHNAPTTKLEKVYELMKTPVQGRQDDCAEDRVLQALLLLDPTAEKVNHCSQAMQKLEADFGLFCLHNYAERFHNEYGAELRFDLKSFAKMVENELERFICFSSN